jgi:hypothetical protein
VWIEDGSTWSPHREAYDNRAALSGAPRWTRDEWSQLNHDCPQPGPYTFDVAGLP